MSLSIFVLPEGVSQKQKFRREWNWRTWSWKNCAMPQHVPTKAHNLKRKWDWHAWTWTASDGRLAPSIQANSEEKRKIVTWNWKTWMWSNCFPLSSLPDEMISHIFSFLPIKDRMKARLNKRLDKIELESKYFVNKLCICELSNNNNNNRLPNLLNKGEQWIIFYKEKSYSSDCIKRIFHNISVKFLNVQLSGSKVFHHEIFNLIPSLAARLIHLKITNDRSISSIMNYEYFLNLARNTVSLHLSNNIMDHISPEALYEVYKIISDSSGIIRLHMKMELKQCSSFLNLIGITNRDGDFFSSRDGIEVYKHSTDDIYEYHMFDGDIHIRFDGNVIDDWRFLESLDDEDEYDDYYDSTPYPVILRRHTTKVSLEKAKKTKGFEKLDGFFTHN